MVELRVYILRALGVIPVEIYWLLLLLFLIGSAVLTSRKGIDGFRSSAVLLLVEWVVLVFCATALFRDSITERDFCLIPFRSYFHIEQNSYFQEKLVINLINVLLFLPIGFFSGCGFQKMTWKKALLLGLVLSVIIELIQLVSRRGICEIDDVIHNTLGCLVGYGFFRLIDRIVSSVRQVFKGNVINN